MLEKFYEFYEEARKNPWKFIALRVIKISGLLFLLGVYSLSLSAGSAANGSYAYHWAGLSLMFFALVTARLHL